MSASIGLQAALAEIEKLGVQSMQVDEWIDPETEKPLKIYWKPFSSARVSRYIGKKSSQANALIVVENATDVNGKKLFEPGDHIPLSKSANFQTVNKIANKMLGIEEDKSDPEPWEPDPLEES